MASKLYGRQHHDAILRRMQEYGGHTVSDVAKAFKLDADIAGRALESMYQLGLADRDDPCGKGKEYVYWPGV